MRITIQTSVTPTEYGDNIIQSDPIKLGPSSNNQRECSYEMLQSMYDVARNWNVATHVIIPVKGKLWSFNPAHIVRMCIVLDTKEENAFEDWAEKQNAKKR